MQVYVPKKLNNNNETKWLASRAYPKTVWCLQSEYLVVFVLYNRHLFEPENNLQIWQMILWTCFKVILLSWTLSIFTTFQWYYDFVIINIVILSFRVAKNYHLRQAKTGETRESWATRRVDPPLLFSKLATYLTCSSYSKCIISFSSYDCFTILIHAISFMLPPLKVIFTLFTNFYKFSFSWFCNMIPKVK